MPEAAQTEFWRDLKPIKKTFRKHSLPEMYTPDIASDDERYYVPLSETVGSRPVWISVSQNSWCDVLMAESAGLVNRHYHPHEVFAYTISGKWGYLEHDWTATAGDFVYETPGEAHTLVAYESGRADEGALQGQGPLDLARRGGRGGRLLRRPRLHRPLQGACLLYTSPSPRDRS